MSAAPDARVLILSTPGVPAYAEAIGGLREELAKAAQPVDGPDPAPLSRRPVRRHYGRPSNVLHQDGQMLGTLEGDIYGGLGRE